MTRGGRAAGLQDHGFNTGHKVARSSTSCSIMLEMSQHRSEAALPREWHWILHRLWVKPQNFGRNTRSYSLR
jgi:hypothetical protein